MPKIEEVAENVKKPEEVPYLVQSRPIHTGQQRHTKNLAPQSLKNVPTYRSPWMMSMEIRLLELRLPSESFLLPGRSDVLPAR